MGQVIQVRNVPDDLHADLAKQAEAAGLSLSRYLLREFERIARRGRNRELFDELSRLPGRRPTTQEIVDTIRQMRDES